MMTRTLPTIITLICIMLLAVPTMAQVAGSGFYTMPRSFELKAKVRIGGPEADGPRPSRELPSRCSVVLPVHQPSQPLESPP